MLYKDLPNVLSQSDPVIDKAAIKQAILNIINTKKGDCPGKPDFGCPLDSYLFEPLDDTLKSLLIGDLNYSLGTLEYRIQVEDISVEVQEAYNRADISVSYSYTQVKTDEYENLKFSIEL